MPRFSLFYILFLLLFISCKDKKHELVDNRNTIIEAEKLQKKAFKDFENEELSSSFFNFNKSKILFESVNDSANVVYNLLRMANIQQTTGAYYGSIESVTEALSYNKKNLVYETAIYNTLGIASKELTNFEDAIYYYNLALKTNTDSITKVAPLNNIAVVFIEQHKYSKAIAILESLSLSKVENNVEHSKTNARILDNLGFAYFKNGSKEKGLALMNQAFNLRIITDAPYDCIESYLHLAEFFIKTNPEKANFYAKKAYDNATRFNSIDERLDALALIISNPIEKNLLAQTAKYITLNDSIKTIRNNFKNKFAKIKYDSKKEKVENQQLRLERAENLLSLQKAKYLRVLSLIILTFLIVLIVLLIRYYKNKNRISKIKVSYETEIRIAKKLHDELANDVFHAITFTETQKLSSERTKELLLQKLDTIYSRVRGISKENNNIDIGKNYSENLKELLSTYNSNATNIIISNFDKINWLKINELKKIALYRVFQELMINMKKHSEASLVVIIFSDTTENLIINYTDNGKGFYLNEITKNGLQNMENRIITIKGTIKFESEPQKGFKVKMVIPK